MAPRSFPLQKPVSGRTQLRNPRRRNVSCHARLGGVATLLGRRTQPFEIWTDHKNLEYFRTAQKLNRRQARWSLYLSRFDFSLHHKPGRTMGKPDTLSRRADHGSSQADNSDIVLLTPELFQVRALEAVTISGEERNTLRDVRWALKDGKLEDSVATAAKGLKQDKSRGQIRSAEWVEDNGLLLYRGKIYVPNDPDL